MLLCQRPTDLLQYYTHTHAHMRIRAWVNTHRHARIPRDACTYADRTYAHTHLLSVKPHIANIYISPLSLTHTCSHTHTHTRARAETHTHKTKQNTHTRVHQLTYTLYTDIYNNVNAHVYRKNKVYFQHQNSTCVLISGVGIINIRIAQTRTAIPHSQAITAEYKSCIYSPVKCTVGPQKYYSPNRETI